MRGFVVPRGMMKLAGGRATADATEFTMTAELGSESYGVLANPYLLEAAKCVSYEVKITVEGDTYTYEEDTVLDMNVLPDLVHHTDRNTLRRVG